MATLSPELIQEILSRLPVKSICRFKCVCKSWLNLIIDPQFVKFHLKRTQRHRLFVTEKLVYNVDVETVTDDDAKVVAVEDDAFQWRLINVKCPSFSQNHYHWRLPRWINVVGSCNGLLCLKVFDDILLYNPSTKQHKKIPCVRSMFTNLYGFGYVESIDDYNFVKVDYQGNFVAVYSLNNDLWMRIQIDCYLSIQVEKDFTYSGNMEGVFINGAIHWVVDNVEHQSEILAFDLVEKKFKILPPPDILRAGHTNFLGLLGGCLCFSKGRNEYSGDFWVMKEYGLKESWTRIMVIPNVFHQLKPLCYLNASDTMLLFMNQHQLVLRNPKDGNLKKIEVEGLPNQVDDTDDADWLDIHMYVESLVSPYCKRDVQTEVSE